MNVNDFLHASNCLRAGGKIIVTTNKPGIEIYEWLCENIERIDYGDLQPGVTRWWWIGLINTNHNIIGFRDTKDALHLKMMDF